MSNPGGAVTRPKVAAKRRNRKWRWWPAVAVLIVLSAAIVVGLQRGGYRTLAAGGRTSVTEVTPAEATAPRVEVVTPREGGIERATVQPGSVHAFESVELNAMVSGYLKTQDVDIGSRVQKGQVLAVIDVPRENVAAAEAEALVEQTRVRERQAEAKVKAMEAERDTAAATEAQTVADIDRLVANRGLAEAQYTRVKALFAQRAVDQRNVDEQKWSFEAAQAAERTARLAVTTARSQVSGATAKIEQARVDVDEAKTAISVAEARLSQARVDLDYARIVAPFDGVVTHRNFHPGAFIRSATTGSQTPLLTVARTDRMRVVVRVPDRDVVLTDKDDPVVLTIDGLEGRAFEGAISRIAHSEDPISRTMRVEIDLPNPDGLLREGMYGRARIELEGANASTRLTVPVACVLDRSGKGAGVVQVVHDDKVERVPVVLGADDGSLVEVKSGLSTKDQVVLRSSIPLEPGMTVLSHVAHN